MEGYIQRFLTLYRPMITRLNELLDSYDITYSLWIVMYHLKHRGASTLVEIASHYEVEKPTITRRVQKVMELGLVEQISGKDKREKIIQLTDLGFSIYDNVRKDITALEFRIMDNIPEHERKIAYEIFPKIYNNLKQERDLL
ncbi:MarR family transcriptional regulator [Oceanobacillus sp. 143]|uniref:MarR family transcriptional regulator n=1 Tax=Oceanobacillus zhaokaii TaxID=2052660 RepID=A0A345PLR3_9BACI|nr:MarR family transcriptional regulator [Oceanobacillus zhaokaii]AXI10943.1 MarR family transcriptional regulator [Oceanobacillus zhaokaii]QGS69778.1 MarR family transcriptional regulator [Oceanobacillus sp. 143]